MGKLGSHKHNADEIIAAIKTSGGIKTTIAQRLGVTRNTVDVYLKDFVTARQAYDNEVESIGDMAESVIIEDIALKSVETAKWYARYKLRDRGYAERNEVTGAGGEALVIEIVRKAAD